MPQTELSLNSKIRNSKRDYVQVNKVTLKDAYPLPNIQEMFTQFKTAKCFTKLDLSQGYFQVPINTKSKPLTAFICEFG